MEVKELRKAVDKAVDKIKLFGRIECSAILEQHKQNSYLEDGEFFARLGVTKQTIMELPVGTLDDISIKKKVVEELGGFSKQFSDGVVEPVGNLGENKDTIEVEDNPTTDTVEEKPEVPLEAPKRRGRKPKKQ